MDLIKIREIADSIWAVRQGGAPCAPITEADPEITIEDAYLVSKEIMERRLADGAKLVGKKIGLTAFAVQKQLGVDQPDFGYLLSDMIVENGGVLPSGSLIQGKVEGEVAFVLKESVQGPGLTNEDIIRATDYVSPCIEIIDSRIANWKIKIQDTIADNASSAFFVLGEEKVPLADIDLVKASMNLWLNEEKKSEGTGKACMDNPLNAVAWLANKMGELGVRLEAGDIILSGAYGPVVPIAEGQQCRVEIAGLGDVKFSYGS